MRIAVDARELQDRPTGVGRFLASVLAAWTDLPEWQDHDVVLLAPDKRAPGGTLWEQFTLPSLVRRCGADVLFCPAYSGPIIPPVPMVVAIHDVSFAAHPEWFGWREGVRRRTIVRLAARAASRVVTISEFSKREIASHLGVPASSIVVAYPGVPTLETASRREDPDPSPRRIVLFVGSIFHRRHIPELLEGFARLADARPDVDLHIVGDNRTSPRIDLAASVSAAGLNDRVTIQHYITDRELSAAYARASAFAFLSDYEGFGLTPLEAIAAGLPVLLLDTPVAREVFADSACYTATAAPALIARGLNTLLFDAGERRRLHDAGQRLLTRYSWTACARVILAALTESARA